MKTTTILISPNGGTSRTAKMVDCTYSVTLKLGYAETMLLVAALEAKQAEYAKLVETIKANGSSEVFKACESIIASLETAVRAVDVQKLIEGGNLAVGTAYVQN